MNEKGEILVDTYVCKLNEECLYKNDKHSIPWVCSNISDINDIVDFCTIMKDYSTPRRALCHRCKKNLREYKNTVLDEPYTITKGEYLHLVTELKEIKEMLTEMRK